MAIDKGSVATIFSSQTVAAAGTQSSAWLNVLEKQAVTTFVRITNGATGPDDRPVTLIEVADDVAGTNPRAVFRAESDIDNNLVTDFIHQHAITDRYIRVTIDNSLGDQAITVDAHAHFVDHLG